MVAIRASRAVRAAAAAVHFPRGPISAVFGEGVGPRPPDLNRAVVDRRRVIGPSPRAMVVSSTVECAARAGQFRGPATAAADMRR